MTRFAVKPFRALMLAMTISLLGIGLTSVAQAQGLGACAVPPAEAAELKSRYVQLEGAVVFFQYVVQQLDAWLVVNQGDPDWVEMQQIRDNVKRMIAALKSEMHAIARQYNGNPTSFPTEAVRGCWHCQKYTIMNVITEDAVTLLGVPAGPGQTRYFCSECGRENYFN